MKNHDFLHETISLLKGDFVILDLGSANALESTYLRPIKSAITLIELDAMTGSTIDSVGYDRHVMIKGAVGGKCEERVFYKRKFSQCSSFLEYKPEIVAAYGLSAFFELDEKLNMQCDTLTSILEKYRIKRVDFLKTDLEGLDYEVISSATDIVSHALVVQSEVRFQPLYEGEPAFHTISEYLTNLGHDLITLRPEFWKYDTPHRRVIRDGRLTWADAIYFLNPTALRERFGKESSTAFIKQIIIARSLGMWSYAEYLYQQIANDISASLAIELRFFLEPDSQLLTIIIRLMQPLINVRIFRGGFVLLGRLCSALSRVLLFSRRLEQIAPTG